MKYDYVFDLPYPPSINDYYFKGRIIKPQGRAYRSFVVDNYKIDNTITSPIFIDIVIFPPDKRKRDVDNVLKCLLDSLTHASIYKDDVLIVHLSIKKGAPIKGGACVVGLKVLEDDFQKKLVYNPGHPLDCLQSYSL